MKNNTGIDSDKILKILNERSIVNLSLEHIAEDTGIELDDLEAQFEKMEDILVAFYLKFMNELAGSIKLDLLAVKGPVTFPEMIYKSMETRYKYRFLARGFGEIMDTNTRLRKHYTSNRIKAKQSFMGVFNVWRNMGYLEEEEFFGMYEDVYARMDLMIEFWPVAANVYVKKGGKEKIITYHRVIANTLYPYLTNKGKEALKEAMKRFI